LPPKKEKPPVALFSCLIACERGVSGWSRGWDERKEGYLVEQILLGCE